MVFLFYGNSLEKEQFGFICYSSPFFAGYNVSGWPVCFELYPEGELYSIDTSVISKINPAAKRDSSFQSQFDEQYIVYSFSSTKRG